MAPLVKLIKQGFDLLAQHGDILGGCDPDDPPIYGKVLVDSDVTESHNIRPFDVWMLLREASRQARGCLADHNQLLQNSALDKLVLCESDFIRSLEKTVNRPSKAAQVA
ncbi:hypothetical protein NW822_03220 [Synechococcus sp. H70.2]